VLGERGPDLLYLSSGTISIDSIDEERVSRGPGRGIGYRFSDRGERELKGVPDRWQLYAVTP